MMEWQDDGVVLAARPYGESAAIVDVFTQHHGRHAGVVRGGMGRRLAPVLQPGSQIALRWRARLEDQLGSCTVEPVKSRAFVLEDRLALAGLSAICAMLQVSLAEREPHPALWAATQPVLDALGTADWPDLYLRWELRLLEELGFGLDLSACAVTGSNAPLAYISPKTGRGVSLSGAGDWAGRLLPLPPELIGSGRLNGAERAQGLAITSHFLAREVGGLQGGKPLPEARSRLMGLLARLR